MNQLSALNRSIQIETKEAYCKECNTYGKVVKEFDGWGTIVSKEGGKV